jgi:hypothetical protein|tara:strand:- start:293 stop:451 length:159 start_codon:yes stop_codon:yes gene_type:complete
MKWLRGLMSYELFVSLSGFVRAGMVTVVQTLGWHTLKGWMTCPAPSAQESMN